MGLSDLVYGIYERRLAAQIPADRVPRHVGVIVDGNRRWASEQGASSSAGHRAGAAKIVEFLGWCDEAGVEVVTLWLLSTDNLNRPPAELDALLGIIENMSYFIAPDTLREYDLFGKGGAEAAARELGVPFLGSIPINVAVRISGDRGTPADVFHNGQQGLAEAVKTIVGNLAGRISVRNLRQPAAPAFAIER